MRQKDTRAFTLIELMVSMTIFSIVMVIAFSQFPFVFAVLKSVENKDKLLYHSFNFREEFNDDDLEVALYDYSTIIDRNSSPFDFENQFRTDLSNLITEGIRSITSEDFRIEQLYPCALQYSEEEYLSETDLIYLEDELDIKTCNDDFDSDNFKSRYKILTVIDRKKGFIKLYFPYLSRLYRIETDLELSLDTDVIIYTDFSRPNTRIHQYKDIYISEFSGESGNKCSNSGTEECLFFDFKPRIPLSGLVKVVSFKPTYSGGEIVGITSSSLKSSYTINKY